MPGGEWQDGPRSCSVSSGSIRKLPTLPGGHKVLTQRRPSPCWSQSPAQFILQYFVESSNKSFPKYEYKIPSQSFKLLLLMFLSPLPSIPGASFLPYSLKKCVDRNDFANHFICLIFPWMLKLNYQLDDWCSLVKMQIANSRIVFQILFMEMIAKNVSYGFE